jgi:hypothetical protein
MKLKLQGATVWLPLLICVLGLSACGGSSGGKSNPPPPPPPPDAGGPPPPPPPPPPAAAAPSALSYTSASTYTTGTALTPLTPTVTGTVTSYVVSPGFPAGITLDATTGQISGTPMAPAPATTYTVTASNATGSTTFDLSFSVLNERVTADRPDEKEGHQVHVIYALPFDAVEDEQLDEKGTIEQSLRILNDWFELETGKKLRLDTHGGGLLDVTFMKLTQTNTQMQGLPRSSVRKELEEQLYLHGFDDVEKMYLVYYGGTGEQCGRGAWPPTLQGNVAALYIGTASGCRNVPFAAGNEPPNFLEFLALHEMLHVLGFVPECAPNYSRTGHVSDSQLDVMFSSDSTGTVLGAPSGLELDVNLNDYFHHGSIPGCLDLGNSAFLDPLPAAAEAPPTWPYIEATDLGCEVEHTPPATLGVDTGILFVNNYAEAPEARLYEVVPDDEAPGQFERVHLEDIPYGDGVIIPRIRAGVLQVVREGAVYVMLVNGNCRHTVRATATPSRFMIQ